MRASSQLDVSQIINMATTPGVLHFHLVAGQEETIRVIRAMNQELDNKLIPLIKPRSKGDIPFQISDENFDQVRALILQAENESDALADDVIIRFSKVTEFNSKRMYKMYVLEKESVFSGDKIQRSTARRSPSISGNWIVVFQTTAAGEVELGQITSKNVSRAHAIVLDDAVLSAPTIQSSISRNGQITGNFSQQDAEDRAAQLNSGPLPAPFITLPE